MSETSKHPILTQSSGPTHGESIHIPASTHWPIVAAFGCTMLLGGILLGYIIFLLGAVLIVVSCIGWFRDMFPYENVEHIHVELQPVEIVTERKRVQRFEIPAFEREPGSVITISPLIAGVKGGIGGGIAMAVVVMIYGLISHGSIWYGINLLGGAGVAGWTHPTTAQIDAFHWEALLIASVIHALASLLMGLVYGSMLPILPRRPVLLGGILAPLVWSGLLYSTLGLIDPALNARISWPWFIVSQFAYGVVAGWIVSRDKNYIRTRNTPFAVRAGLEAPGLMEENHQGENHEGENH